MPEDSEDQLDEEFNAGWDDNGAPEKDEATESQALDVAHDEVTPGIEDESAGQPDTQAINDAQQADSQDAENSEAEDVDYKEMLDKERHRAKSWEGRITKEATQRKEAEARVVELEARLSKVGEGENDQKAEEADSLKELRESFRDEYGEELPDYVDKIIEKNARKKFEAEINDLKSNEIQPLIDQLAEVRANEQLRLARDVVLSAHPDMDEIIQAGKLENWIETLPATFKDAAMHVYEAGNPQQVLDLLTQYKTSQQSSNRNPRKVLRENGAVVETRSAPPPKGAPNKDDYDAGWGQG